MSRRTKITTLMGGAAMYPMKKPDAVGYLNNLSAGRGMHYIVWGDDDGEQYLFDR
jgi:hypothetical protein